MPSYHPSLYPNHPIQIPEELPKVLKLYTKAAIRTQPADLLLWSASYFRCMANGEQPPVKERLEYPLPQTWYGLTTGKILTLLLRLVTLIQSFIRSCSRPSQASGNQGQRPSNDIAVKMAGHLSSADRSG